MDLTNKQKCFVAEYLVDLNATQAAIRAGYSEKTAGQIGERLLKKVEVRQAIESAMKEREQRTEITQDAVMRDIEAIKRDAMQHIPDKEGNLVMANHNAALKAAELQGKHLGMFKDKLEVTGKDGNPLIPGLPPEKLPDDPKELGALYNKIVGG